MNFMKKNHYRIMLLWLAVILCITACGMKKLTAEESFNRAVAGLAGVDNLTFKGNAVIKSGNSGLHNQSIAFQGQLQDHSMLTITTSKSPPSSTKLAGSLTESTSFDGLKGKMEYDGEKWHTLAGHTDTDWMARMNPLEQLMLMGESDKKITEELGAARGTKVLRIELSQGASQELTKNMLSGQMQAIRSRLDQKGDALYTDNPKVKARLLAVWESENRELNRLLAESNVNTVFHMTIDKKTYLPSRLTSERTISVHSSKGQQRAETLVSDIRFMDYR